MKDKFVVWWFLHRVIWQMTLRHYYLKFRHQFAHFIEWGIKSRFGFGIWRRTRYLRIVARIVDDKPVWTLCQQQKAFIGWRKVDLATSEKPEHLLVLAAHRMQPAQFLRPKSDGTFDFLHPRKPEEKDFCETLTYAMNVFYDSTGKAGNWKAEVKSDVLP